MEEAHISLKERIQKMTGEDKEINPEEFANLILDATQINEITAEDCSFLSGFTNLERLSMNATGLKNLNNLPKEVSIVKLELADNKISGDELAKLTVYKSTLAVLKLSNNKISTLDQLQPLKDLSELLKLDLTGNEVCNVDGYRSKIFEMIPSLYSLDGQDADGASVPSDDSDYGEEGELENSFELDDFLNQKIQKVLEGLDPETRQKYENGEIGIEDLKSMGLINDDDIDGYGEEFEGEMGEDEYDEEGEDDDEGLGKRGRDGAGENGVSSSNKKQKDGEE